MTNIMKLCALIIVLLYFNTSSCEENKTNYRLPRHIIPKKYYVTIEPTLYDNATTLPFHGSLSLDFMVTEQSNNITLHKHKLQINDSRISIKALNTSEYIKISHTEYHIKTQFYVIVFETPINPHALYRLDALNFHGSMYLYDVNQQNERHGIHIAQYSLENGDKRNFIITEFQKIQARQVFPCLDEPNYKSFFELKIIRTSNYTTLSNGELVASKSLRNGKFEDTYNPNVLQTTYSLAFIISDYKFIKNGRQQVLGNAEGIEKGLGDLALEAGVKMLDYLEQYFDFNYTLSKLDHVAVPDIHLTPNAYEFWGLLMYRQNSLYYSEKNSTSNEKLGTKRVIAHEIAHQFFGNLVTMDWWNYYWLNEGFATFLAFHLNEKVYPDHGFLLQQLINIRFSLEYEIDYDTPLTSEGNMPGDVAHNIICYEKASGIIRMMMHFLGEDVFRDGIKIYLQKHQFGSVTSKDLYEALEEALNYHGKIYLLSNMKLQEVMEPWEKLTGHPLVNISMDYENYVLNVTQNEHGLDSDKIWNIPINFAFGFNETANSTENNSEDHFNSSENKLRLDKDDARFLSAQEYIAHSNSSSLKSYLVMAVLANVLKSNINLENYFANDIYYINTSGYFETTPDYWLTKRTILIKPHLKTSMKTINWYVANKQFTGYYRVNYDLQNWNQLIKFLNEGDFENFIHPISRFQLIEDSFTLASMNVISYDIPIRLSAYVKREKHYEPIRILLHHINDLHFKMQHHPEFMVFQKYVNEILAPIMKSLGYTENSADTELTKVVRAELVKLLLEYNDKTTKSALWTLFDEWTKEKYEIPPNMKDAIFCAGFTDGDESDWNYLHDIGFKHIPDCISNSDYENSTRWYFEKVFFPSYSNSPIYFSPTYKRVIIEKLKEDNVDPFIARGYCGIISNTAEFSKVWEKCAEFYEFSEPIDMDWNKKCGDKIIDGVKNILVLT